MKKIIAILIAIGVLSFLIWRDSKFDTFDVCTKYKVVKEYTYAPTEYNSSAPFYVEFTDGTGTEFTARNGNNPVVGQSLCVDYKRVVERKNI